MTSGSVIPKITKGTLAEISLPLPRLETQEQAVNVQRLMSHMRGRLQGLERELWEQPATAARVSAALNALNPADEFRTWLESLPFPLSSILYAYNAQKDVRLKNEHLYHFFEALAQFVACAMVSAFRSDRVFFEANRDQWFGAAGKQQSSLARATFGDWVIAGRRLAKFTREQLSGKSEERERCLELYALTDPDNLRQLTSKDLFEVLEGAQEHRNSWKGHAGVESSAEAKRRLTILEAELAKVHEVLGYCFAGWLLVRPGGGEFREGIFTYAVDVLMGPNPLFPQRTAQSTVPMDVSKLYLMQETAPRPLELVPLIRFLSSPEQEENACYFYNRVQRDQVRWVSYHFEREWEKVGPDPELLAFLTDVSASVPQD